MLIVLIVIGIIVTVVKEINVRDGVHDTTITSAVVFGGLWLAILCGVTGVIAGAYPRSKQLVKKIATAGIVIGVLGILMGILAWISYYMISSFATSF
jgi:hypothetical protein